MSTVEGKPASLPTERAVGGITGICPKCKKGELGVATIGRYTPFLRDKRAELVNRAVYRCNNPDCNYENVAIVFDI
jgi:topoisomerase IA-like protein